MLLGIVENSKAVSNKWSLTAGCGQGKRGRESSQSVQFQGDCGQTLLSDNRALTLPGSEGGGVTKISQPVTEQASNYKPGARRWGWEPAPSCYNILSKMSSFQQKNRRQAKKQA